MSISNDIISIDWLVKRAQSDHRNKKNENEKKEEKKIKGSIKQRLGVAH